AELPAVAFAAGNARTASACVRHSPYPGPRARNFTCGSLRPCLGSKLSGIPLRAASARAVTTLAALACDRLEISCLRRKKPLRVNKPMTIAARLAQKAPPPPRLTIKNPPRSRFLENPFPGELREKSPKHTRSLP